MTVSDTSNNNNNRGDDNSYGNDDDIKVEDIKKAYERDPPPPNFSEEEWDFVIEKSTDLYNYLFSMVRDKSIPRELINQKTINAILTTAVMGYITTLMHYRTDRETKNFIRRFISEMISRLGFLDTARDLT